MPKVAIATAMASSKLFEAAVKESVVDSAYVAPTRALIQGHHEHHHEVDCQRDGGRTTSRELNNRLAP